MDRMTRLGAWLFGVGSVAVTGCGGSPHSSSASTGGSTSVSVPCAPDAKTARLRLNEISSQNDGNAIDELGETDDWIELINAGKAEANLADYSIALGGDNSRLPNVTLLAGERAVLWADGEVAEGPLHLPAKLSSLGERVTLLTCGKAVDDVEVPPLATNDVFSRFPDASGPLARCRYASPGRPNPERCEPLAPPEVTVQDEFLPYEWTLPVSAPPKPLTIDELALLPASFIELRNTSDAAVLLDDYRLTLAGLRPGAPLPTLTEGVGVALPPGVAIEPDERVIIPLLDADTALISATPNFEGVASLFSADGTPIERVDFAQVPPGASLARLPSFPHLHVFCSPATPGEANDACEILPSRALASYDRYERTLGDYDALSDGGGELGLASVKFIVDLQTGGQVYMPNASDWSLHYEFVREVIDGQPRLNRCVDSERLQFNQGWYDFSVTQYFDPIGRRYLLGTLEHHAATDLYTVEFAVGDQITPADMRRAFFAATAHTLHPERYFLRPQDDTQTARAKSLNGTLPIVDRNAPFVNVKWQPLTAGVGYGTLTFVTADDLANASLGPDAIVITDDVPNDIPQVGGLITEAFQTPLSHVNVLCQNRGTPNLALPGARAKTPFADLLGKLVRFEVSADGYSVTETTTEEAAAYWAERYGKSETLVPRIDTSLTGIVSLEGRGLEDLPAIGAKAAQLAEVISAQKTATPSCGTGRGFSVPTPAYAIPVGYFVEHMKASGAAKLLAALTADSTRMADRKQRYAALEAIRSAIATKPIAKDLVERLTQLLKTDFGTETVRFRSSSNAEDLPGFNGAGLYTSTSVKLGDLTQTVERGLVTVWQSLFLERAFDERELLHVDHSRVAMGILVHQAFLDERANGVIITRDVQDIVRGDIYTFNAQTGEAAVTNPAPGVSSDEFIYRLPPRTPTITERARSSLSGGIPVMTETEVIDAACAAKALSDRFSSKLDPERKNSYFTLDIEFKLLGGSRKLLIKQARPYSFGSWDDPGDCRQF